ncbi:MAG: hypothetical protein ACRDJ0_16490 [Actinomycetota bacterium]
MGIFFLLGLPGCHREDGRMEVGVSTLQSKASMMARIVCGDKGASSLHPNVRGGNRGVNLVFENRSKAEEFYVREYDKPDSNQGGSLASEKTVVTASFPPGELLVGCFSGEAADYYATNLPEYTIINVIDPGNLHSPTDLDCHNAAKGGEFDGGPRPNDVRSVDMRSIADGIMRTTVPGLLKDDVLNRPGWPRSSWHSEPRVVVREGHRVAMLSLWLGSRWTVSVEACSGSGIG